MRRFLIIVAILVAVILLLNFYISRIASDAVHQGLERFIEEQEDETVALRFDETSVNTLAGGFRITGLEIEQLQSGEHTRIGELAVSVSWRDFAGLLASRGSDQAPVIRRGNVTMTDLEHMRNSSTGYRIDLLTLDFDGNLGDLMKSFDSGFRKVPAYNQAALLEIHNFQPVIDINFDLLNTGFSLPTPTLRHILVDGTYTAETDRLAINRLELNQDQTEYDVEITIDRLSGFYGSSDADEDEIPFIQAKLRGTSTEREQVGLMPGGIGLHYETLMVGYEGPFRRGGSWREMFFSDKSTVELEASEVTLFSPEQFRQNYGQAFRFLGVPDDQITIPGISASYTISREKAEIREFSFNNPFADVSVTGSLLMHKESPWEWENAALRINPKTNESRNFIKTMSSFFSLNIPEEDGVYIIRITGTLEDPSLEGISTQS